MQASRVLAVVSLALAAVASAPAHAQGAACVQPQPVLEPIIPWADAEQLCKKAPRGEPWAGAIPPLGPDWPQKADGYALHVQAFLRDLKYRKAPYEWLHDASWRLTGEFEGCPCPPGQANCPPSVSKGPHPAVRIYYSPEVIDWMCKYRLRENEVKDAPDMPDGAMIIKEMLPPNKTNLALVPGTQKLWIAPMPGKPADYYDTSFSSWTIMIKAQKGSADGWYWAFFDRSSDGVKAANPPMWDRCAFAQKPYPGSDGKPVTAPPGCEWYPTFWQYSTNDVQFPNYQFGNYCVYCHASAQGQTTFASFPNLLAKELRYVWSPGTSQPIDFDDHARRAALAPVKPAKTAKAPAPSPTPSCAPNPFPSPRPSPLPGFTQAFPELKPRYEEVWDTRLPAQTWDHVVSLLGVGGIQPDHSQFVTSDQCQGCHEAGGSGQLDTPYMVARVKDRQVDLSPWAEWSVSPMGLGGRDPIFHAQLELERNLARKQPGLAPVQDCIDNLCLHCHGAPGARQWNVDTAGQGPPNDLCRDFLPPKDERRATNYDGKLFTQKMVFAWRDEQGAHEKYGGLARDGINCATCHHIADVDLDQQNLKRTFTGNFRVGPPDRLYGPFPNPDSPEPLRPKPMEHSLGITPEFGKQMQGSELCGTCHTVFLPVFDDRGAKAGTSYEQSTYLEWLLSEFGTPGGAYGQGKSCQDCHMPHDYQGTAIKTGIANVQDTRYPAADFLLPAADVDIPLRPYRRHKLYGLNAFLAAFAQQFPLLMGLRQQDYMNPYVDAPLLTAIESVLDVAERETAELTLDQVAWNAGQLEARVSLKNLAGHHLPTGVGFRRLFVELLVLDAQDTPLWASGRTNAIGQILLGTSDQPLPTESWKAGKDGLPFQPHHQVITDGSQVQIYEELTQNTSLGFTSSFIHRYWEIKDNRVRPNGWNPARVLDPGRRAEYGDATRPGLGPERHWWPVPETPEHYKNPQFPAIEAYEDTRRDPDYDLAAHEPQGLPGTDSLLYRIALTPQQRAQARKLRVTLNYQSAPPPYLQERFALAAQPGAEKRAATQLYYMAGHLNTAATTRDGQAYLSGYKLRVAQPVEQTVPVQ